MREDVTYVMSSLIGWDLAQAYLEIQASMWQYVGHMALHKYKSEANAAGMGIMEKLF